MHRMHRMGERLRGPVPRTTKKRTPAPVVRGPVPRMHPQPLHIKVLTDLFSVYLLMSIDIQVLSDLAFILFILHILAILLQTKKSAQEDNPPRAIHASAVSNRAYAVYFACLTSPNVFNARCAGDTGPRNRRVTNVSACPPNETSSIW